MTLAEQPAVARSAAFAQLSPGIIEDVKNGVSIDDSAGRWRVDRRTIYRWQRRGLEAKARRDAEQEVSGEDELYIDFAERLVAARYEAKVEAESILRQHIVGFQEEDVTEISELRNGELTVVKRTVRRRKRRSLQALLEWLARRYPREYSPRLIAELTGADGGPVSLDIVDRANSIADQAEEHLRARAEAPDAEAELAEDRPS